MRWLDQWHVWLKELSDHCNVDKLRKVEEDGDGWLIFGLGLFAGVILGWISLLTLALWITYKHRGDKR